MAKSISANGVCAHDMPVCRRNDLDSITFCCVACSTSGVVELATLWSMGEVQLVPDWLYMQLSDIP